MFSTLRYTADSNKEAICIEQASNPPGQSHSQQHSACNYCRAKKLKCIREINGSEDRKKPGTCDRCRSKEIECVFAGPSSARGSKRRRSSHPSKDTQKPRGTSDSSSTSISTTSSAPYTENPGSKAIKTSHEQVSSPSGDFLVDDTVDFNLSTENEFMDLLDMVSPEMSVDSNHNQSDFSSLGLLPNESFNFDFDADAGGNWPVYTPGMGSSSDFRSSLSPSDMRNVLP
ncbi:MAG: hypothetical protein Q9209_001498 [Squamulea sp. 1 TL-2023]